MGIGSPPLSERETRAERTGRWMLGGMLVFAGFSHLTFARQDFHAQVPPWIPMDPDRVVLLSGLAEISLGSSLLLVKRRRKAMGWIAGSFFTAIFPGNIAQYTHHRNAFGLDTDTKRFVRLFFQPVLVAWALWSTGATKNTCSGRPD